MSKRLLKARLYHFFLTATIVANILKLSTHHFKIWQLFVIFCNLLISFNPDFPVHSLCGILPEKGSAKQQAWK